VTGFLERGESLERDGVFREREREVKNEKKINRGGYLYPTAFNLPTA
jgi:hypothetical protein